MQGETTNAKTDEPSSNPDNLNMTRMQGDFDERVSRTKSIVTQLAQRLHEVKRDTYNELDKIQGRNSHRTQSGSNSKSPNSMAARQMVIGSGSGKEKKQ